MNPATENLPVAGFFFLFKIFKPMICTVFFSTGITVLYLT